jgi:hypothetical protein
VGDQVLVSGVEYPGRAYVVKEWFITRYQPFSPQNRVVGTLYVGAREAAFQQLVKTFVARAIHIAVATILLAALLSLPISIAIARPIAQLVEANRELVEGDMSVRVRPVGGRG